MIDKTDVHVAQLSRIEERLAQSPIWKALIDGALSLIPGVGQAISSALSTRAANLAQKRTSALIEEIRGGVARLDTAKLDRTFLDSDEFTSVLVRTLELNARSSRAEKVRLFAATFLGFVHVPGSQVLFKETFLRIVDELEPEHIEVLRIIYRESGPNRASNSAGRARVELVAPELGLEQGRVLALGVHLMRFGLVQDDSIGRSGYTPGRWVVTAFGSEFIDHIVGHLSDG